MGSNNSTKGSFEIAPKKIVKVYGLGGLIAMLIVAGLGYLQYGTLQGVIGSAAIGAIYWYSIILGIIPFGGMVAYYFFQSGVIEPWIFNIAGITASPLTNIMYWVCFAIATIINAIISVVVIALLARLD